MDDNIKNRLVLIFGILTLVFFLFAAGSCDKAREYKIAKDKEYNLRFELDEKLSNFNKDKQALEGKIANLTQELEIEKAASQVTKKALLQEQLISQSLKEEVEKVTKLKEALGEDLKEALSAKGTKTKK